MQPRKRALRIVVLDARPDARDAQVTAAVAHALSAAVEDDSDSEVAPGSTETLAARPTANPLESADAAVVFDPASWTRAREAKVPFVAVVFPTFDTAWAGDLARADCVLVAHSLLVDDVVHRGADRARVHVAGPVTPAGFSPSRDRAASRRQAGVPTDAPIFLVTADAIDHEGFDELFAAIGRVSSRTGLFVDVGEDVELAEALRQRATSTGVNAWMFADGPGVASRWRLVDLVLASVRGHEVPRALGVGAPVLLLPPGRSDRLAAEALVATGAARVCRGLDQLSADIDAALDPKVLATSRAAVEALGATTSAGRVASIVRDVWRGTRAPHGLPHGLEKLPSARS